MVTESRSAKKGSKGKKRCWERVDGSSGRTLGTHEAGEREGGGREAPRKSRECGEEGLGLELKEDEEPLLEDWLGGLFCGEGLEGVDKRSCACQSVLSSRSWPGIKDFHSRHHFGTSK